MILSVKRQEGTSCHNIAFFTIAQQDTPVNHFFNIFSTFSIAIPENNAIKTVQQSAKDKEGICRRADARQRYLTQDFTL